MIRLSWFVVAIVAFPILPSYGAEQSAPSDQEIKVLVDRLASRNPRPITSHEDRDMGPDYRLPPGFESEKQLPVRDAYSQLRKLGILAFPMLIERWDDKHYSVTASNQLSGWCRNYSVGEVCQMIIYDYLQPYGYWQAGQGDPRGRRLRPQYPERFLGSKPAAKKWWERHKDKTLSEMQLEAIDWVIAEEAKKPKQFSATERKRLQEIRDKLAKRKEPLSPGNYYCEDIEK